MIQSPLVHEDMNQFPINDGQLLIGGKPLDTIANMLDKQVFYAYDKSVVEAKIALFHRHIPSRIKLHYAIKANPCRDHPTQSKHCAPSTMINNAYSLSHGVPHVIFSDRFAYHKTIDNPQLLYHFKPCPKIRLLCLCLKNGTKI